MPYSRSGTMLSAPKPVAAAVPASVDGPQPTIDRSESAAASIDDTRSAATSGASLSHGASMAVVTTSDGTVVPRVTLGKLTISDESTALAAGAGGAAAANGAAAAAGSPNGAAAGDANGVRGAGGGSVNISTPLTAGLQIGKMITVPILKSNANGTGATQPGTEMVSLAGGGAKNANGDVVININDPKHTRVASALPNAADAAFSHFLTESTNVQKEAAAIADAEAAREQDGHARNTVVGDITQVIDLKTGQVIDVITVAGAEEPAPADVSTPAPAPGTDPTAAAKPGHSISIKGGPRLMIVDPVTRKATNRPAPANYVPVTKRSMAVAAANVAHAKADAGGDGTPSRESTKVAEPDTTSGAGSSSSEPKTIADSIKQQTATPVPEPVPEPEPSKQEVRRAKKAARAASRNATKMAADGASLKAGDGATASTTNTTDPKTGPAATPAAAGTEIDPVTGQPKTQDCRVCESNSNCSLM